MIGLIYCISRLGAFSGNQWRITSSVHDVSLIKISGESFNENTTWGENKIEHWNETRNDYNKYLVFEVGLSNIGCLCKCN